MRAGLMMVAAALMATGCGADLPEGWEDAEKIDITQGACEGNPYEGNPEAVTTTSRAGAIDLLYAKAHFRCEQKVEAFLKTSADGMELLFQPADMDPWSVAKCDCLYDLSVSLEATAGERKIMVWRRWDNLNEPNDPQPIGAATVTVP